MINDNLSTAEKTMTQSVAKTKSKKARVKKSKKNVAIDTKETETMTNEIINTNNNDINAEETTVNEAVINETAVNETIVEQKEIETMSTENINNSNNNNNATAIQVAGLPREQLMAILQNAGIDTSTVNITTKQPKINDKLTYLDEEKTQAICSANHDHIFDINELDETTKIEVMKSGLCPNCLNIMKQAAAIKAASGFRTRTVTNNQPSVEKPGFKIREILKANLNNIDDELLAQLQDKTFSREHFKLAYPMFLNITGMSADEIKVARKDAKNHDRYSPQVYTINNQQFLLTNDLYGKNLEPIANFFAKLA